MKWYFGLILGLCLAFGASVSRGAWILQIHKGGTVQEHFLADIDSLTFRDPTVPVGMVYVPAGTFIMGSPTDEPGRGSDETQHQVTLTGAIYVSTYEVTQSEWVAVMGWNESSFPGVNRPVETVTWYDAVSYCNQRSTADGLMPAYTLTGVVYSGNHITSATVTWNQAGNGYRLLTEAEWEYACRATSTTAFCNGGITNLQCTPLDPNLDQVGWYCGNASSMTHDVGGKTANASGLKDMHGNVWEWCWDRYGAYPAGQLTDPTGPASGSYRVMRGGCWSDYAQHCRSAYRTLIYPDGRGYFLGFRLSRTAP
jgi:formylglycine-generating enzyme required for sulfatase activity